MTDLKGKTLKKQYFLRELAGSGGMADVYLAWDTLRSAKMAVKILRRDLTISPKFIDAFTKEAEFLQKLNHPNIVRMYESGKEKDIVFIVMAWIDGTDLKKRITSLNRPLTLAEVSQILNPICSALHFAHQKQAYHCDIKPSNILLHENGREVFLADFGVARVAQEQAGGGTLPYMAPEQFAHGTVSPQTDIYAMGIMLYEMLSGGILPYRGDTKSHGTTPRERFEYEHRHLPLPSLLEFNPKAPQSVIKVIQRATNKNPVDRFRSALELINAFEQARKSLKDSESDYQTIYEPITSPPIPPLPVKPPEPQRPPARPTQPGGNQGISSSPKLGVPHLFVRSGEMVGQSIPILSRAGTTIGRSANCQIHLQERSVSRLHATIMVTKKGAYIRDEGSSLGTYLNGKRLQPNVPEAIRHCDVIQTGYFQVFEFRLK